MAMYLGRANGLVLRSVQSIDEGRLSSMVWGTRLTALMDEEEFQAQVSREVNGEVYMQWSDGDEWWQVPEHSRKSVLSLVPTVMLHPEPEP
eukprot:COSAG02_NODE_39915_length_411_cov_0.817308_1_plen_90_part_10